MHIVPKTACFLALAFCLPLQASDLAETIAECNDCHGADGVSTDSDIPTIAGQSYIVLEDALLAYADEARPCAASDFRHGDTSRPAKTMCEVAAALSEDQIAALAEHYEGLPFVPAEQPFDASLVAAGAELHERHCDRCHSEGGSYAGDDAGILAGQWTPFLRQTTQEFLSGERPMPEKMAEKMERLDEAQVEALLNFYASQGAKG